VLHLVRYAWMQIWYVSRCCWIKRFAYCRSYLHSSFELRCCPCFRSCPLVTDVTWCVQLFVRSIHVAAHKPRNGK
jgi:hypothetical protein